MASSRPTTKIVVVGGGGTFGASTALHLLRSGYTPGNITVLDTFEIPSAQSAGNDLNKIMGIRLRNHCDIQLSLEARDMWRNDELFKPYFHNTGRGWKAIYSQDGGWLAAAKAIDAIGHVLKKSGVNFGFGSAGSFKKPLFSEGQINCIGVETTDGTQYLADKVVLAAGAWSPTLVDLEEQCCSKAWVYTHIQLSASEAAAYKDIPVVYNEDVGFFFEPNEHGVIKVCDEFPGFSHFQSHQPYGATSPKSISVPRSHAQNPSDTYPDQSDITIRRAIATYLPAFSDKPLFNKTMCWCTDTADASLLICEHPKWKNFYLATGDSGHSFKLLPIIGKHIVELLEGTLAADLADYWRWRPGSGDALTSRRGAPPQDLADLPGWRHDAQAS